MSLIDGILLAKNIKKNLDRRKAKSVDSLSPKGPDKPLEKSAGSEPHKFSAEDEKLIEAFRSTPLKLSPDDENFLIEHRDSINNFFETRKQFDWERLATFFLRHSKYAELLNDAGTVEVARRFGEQANRYGVRAVLPLGIRSVSGDTTRAYLRSHPIPSGAPERSAMELAMRHAPVNATKFFDSRKEIMEPILSNPAFLRKK